MRMLRMGCCWWGNNCTNDDSGGHSTPWEAPRLLQCARPCLLKAWGVGGQREVVGFHSLSSIHGGEAYPSTRSFLDLPWL